MKPRSSLALIATLSAAMASAVSGCKKVVEATVNEADDTTTDDSSTENNDAQLTDCADATQPTTHAGPQMVAVGRRDGSCVWIDTTEVTNAQLGSLVALSVGERAMHYPDGCASDDLGMRDSLAAELPASNVTWCDAAAFCTYAGKRLCTELDGASEWQTVCTDGDHGDFAFDDLADPEICRIDADAAVVVGSLSDCRTPTGVVDLVGNVREWTDECSGKAPAGECVVRGGSYLDDASTSGCEAAKSVERVHAAADIGVRCCADVP